MASSKIKYVVSSAIDPTPYRGTSAVPQVGTSCSHAAQRGCPKGKIAARFYAGDLGYGTYDAREVNNDDDFMVLYIPKENLTQIA